MDPMTLQLQTSQVSMAGQTYIDIKDIAEKDGSILVVPVGSVEQHGYHLPVGTDTLIVDAVANAGAESVEDTIPVLVTPPVWSGFSPHHMGFGGTIDLEHDLLIALLKAVADSSLQNGFDSLLLLNGHGGNIPLVDTATGVIGKDHPETEVTSLTYFQLILDFVDNIRDSDVGGTGHGGEIETSILLHLYPDLVDTEQFEGTMMDEPYDEGVQDLTVSGPLSVYRPFSEYSTSGAIGDPTVADAKKGEQLFNKLRDEVGELLLNLHNENANTQSSTS